MCEMILCSVRSFQHYNMSLAIFRIISVLLSTKNLTETVSVSIDLIAVQTPVLEFFLKQWPADISGVVELSWYYLGFVRYGNDTRDKTHGLCIMCQGWDVRDQLAFICSSFSLFSKTFFLHILLHIYLYDNSLVFVQILQDA